MRITGVKLKEVSIMQMTREAALEVLHKNRSAFPINWKNKRLAVLFSRDEMEEIRQYLEANEMDQLPAFASHRLYLALGNDKITSRSVRLYPYVIREGWIDARYLKVGREYVYDIYVSIRHDMVFRTAYKYHYRNK